MAMTTIIGDSQAVGSVGNTDGQNGAVSLLPPLHFESSFNFSLLAQRPSWRWYPLEQRKKD